MAHEEFTAGFETLLDRFGTNEPHFLLKQNNVFPIGDDFGHTVQLPYGRFGVGRALVRLYPYWRNPRLLETVPFFHDENYDFRPGTIQKKLCGLEDQAELWETRYLLEYLQRLYGAAFGESGTPDDIPEIAYSSVMYKEKFGCANTERLFAYFLHPESSHPDRGGFSVITREGAPFMVQAHGWRIPEQALTLQSIRVNGITHDPGTWVGLENPHSFERYRATRTERGSVMEWRPEWKVSVYRPLAFIADKNERNRAFGINYSSLVPDYPELDMDAIDLPLILQQAYAEL